MIIRLRSRRPIPMRPADGEGGDLGAAPPVADTTAAPAVADVTAPVVAEPVAPPAGPATMLEAVTAALQPRDDQGRFTFKDAAGNAVDAQGNRPPVAAPAPTAPPVAVEPPQPEDPLQMPDGLQPKAQERFQALANGIKERDAQLVQAQESISYVQTQFQEHGVKQEQFEQAMSVVGMINRGDFQGAQRVLMEQLQQVALLGGQPLSQVDPLANFPELRQRVDALQISEADAVQLAGLQTRQHMQGQAAQRQQQQAQQQRQQQETEQAQQQAVQKGLGAIDTFCKRMQGSDVDFAVIEAKLLPIIPKLVQGLPPERWAEMVELQYQTLKDTAAQFRQTLAPQQGTVLRPTGQVSPGHAPKSMHEAMWGRSGA